MVVLGVERRGSHSEINIARIDSYYVRAFCIAKVGTRCLCHDISIRFLAAVNIAKKHWSEEYGMSYHYGIGMRVSISNFTWMSNGTKKKDFNRYNPALFSGGIYVFFQKESFA